MSIKFEVRLTRAELVVLKEHARLAAVSAVMRHAALKEALEALGAITPEEAAKASPAQLRALCAARCGHE